MIEMLLLARMMVLRVAVRCVELLIIHVEAIPSMLQEALWMLMVEGN